VTDYFDVDPALGGLDDFDRFVAEAHARQLRVVLDFVPSHVSARHPHFEAARSHAESPYVSWFRFQAWPEEYATFFGVETMPQLNHDEPAVRDHLIDAARFWLDRGVDGFRLDYAGGSSYELWAEFRAAVRAHRPDCWLFGEVVDTPDVQRTYEGLFDGCLDFQLSLALRRAFGFGTVRADELARLIDDHEAAFPAHFSRPSFLDNHDLDRIRFISGGDLRRVRIAALCQFALAGPPVVYYGTEVGLSQEFSIHGTDDRHARLPMRWDAGLEDSLVPYYRALADLRQELAGAPRTTLAASADRLSFSRGDIVVELDLGELTGVARRGADVLLRA
jgi:glycosidase